MNTNAREKSIFRITWIGSIVNFLLLVFKFVAGFLGHSSALVADAVHSLSDFVTDIIVIVFVKISGKPEDEDHRYGHGKYETLATALIGLALFAVGVGLLAGGATKVVEVIKGAILPAPSIVALVAAAVSIVSKEILYRYTVRVGKNLNSQAVIANAWHHRSDAFSSVGTLVGIGGAIFLGEKWRVLDPIAAIVVSAFILKVAIDLIKPCVDELLERSLPFETERQILAIITSFPEISSPHHLRTRRIGNNYAIEVHIRMDGQTTLEDAHTVATNIERRLKAEFGPETHIGIHMEPLKTPAKK
ncbi:MAG: cation transporter [Bacteroidales bacterium]|nr:cation transporter [Bacteroidales bacterium]